MAPYTEKNLAKDIDAVIKELKQIRTELIKTRKAVLEAMDVTDPGDGFPDDENETEEE